MGEILLSTEKQNRFESMIERAIREAFDERADVLVRSNGRVFIRAEGSRSEAAEVVQNRDELFGVLSKLEFEFERSSYELTDGDDEALVGASFYLQRDGW